MIMNGRKGYDMVFYMKIDKIIRIEVIDIILIDREGKKHLISLSRKDALQLAEDINIAEEECLEEESKLSPKETHGVKKHA